MRIDAHTHIWLKDAERFPWQPIGGYIPERDAPAADLIEIIDRAGINRAVLVQPTPYGWDNAYIVAASHEFPGRFTTVCLVNPYAPESGKILERLVKNEGARGVRFNWNLEPDLVWEHDLDHRQVWAAAQELKIPICLQLLPDQIEQAARLALAFPQVSVVLDHLGRPVAGSAPDSPAFQRFLSLADLPNCFIKFSGMHYYSKAKAPFEETWALLSAALQAFGAQRCMFGSDFPFVLDHWPSYESLLKSFCEHLELTDQQKSWVFGETALSLGW
jgi:predicted TIM-barrel fold metal-dependent hydrolase